MWQNKRFLKGNGLSVGCIRGDIERAIGIKTIIDIEPQNRNVIRMDARKMSFQNSLFDYVICISTLEHIREDRKALKEMHRVLKPCGYLIVDIPIDMGLWSKLDVDTKHYRRYEPDLSDLPYEGLFEEVKTTRHRLLNANMRHLCLHKRSARIILRKI
jgi:SAM-dependent methyltransferase